MRLLKKLVWALYLAVCAAGFAEIGGGDTYGSGQLGSWITDEDGLPAYAVDSAEMRRHANGISQPQHMLGNQVTTAFVHPEGYAQLFTTRTFPRFANTYALDKSAFAGGFGYVQEADRVWSTAGPDLPAGSLYKMHFGAGYTERTITSRALKIVQRLYLANGEEALIDEIAFTNQGTTALSLGYIAYWDVNWTIPTTFGPMTDPATVKGAFDSQRNQIKLTNPAAKGILFLPSLTKDPAPKASYFVGLSHPIESYETLQPAFFGSGSRPNPIEATSKAKLPNRLPPVGTKQQDTLLAARFALTVPAGATVRLYSAYGITNAGTEAAAADRLRAGYKTALSTATAELKSEMPVLTLPSDRWLERELAWDYYHLKAGLLQEDYWGENGLRILNQGSAYLYNLGQNISMRDPLQHVLPLFYTKPELGRDTLIYALMNVGLEGKLPYGTAGYGAATGTLLNFEPSDIALWLTWAVSEYVHATKDRAFLQTKVRTRGEIGERTVADLIKRSLQYQIDKIGYGRHGLVRILNSDWNDVLITGAGNPAASIKYGESTVNSAIAVYVYGRYQSLIAGSDAAFATRLSRERQKILAALRNQWRGTHFNRAYVALTSGEAMGEVGAEALWLEANAYALLSEDTMTSAQLQALIGKMKAELSDPSPIGMAIVAPGFFPQFRSGLTFSTWPSINSAAIQGLLYRSRTTPGARELAWTELTRNSLAAHAESYPRTWYGTWSGPDSYYSEIHRGLLTASTPPGNSFMDGTDLILFKLNFPTANMHPHSQPLFCAVRFAGIEGTAEGFTIDPKFPHAEFSWTTSTHSVAYTPRQASGTLKVVDRAPFFLTVALPAGLTGQASVSVGANGSQATAAVSGPTVRFSVTPDSAGRVRWFVR